MRWGFSLARSMGVRKVVVKRYILSSIKALQSCDIGVSIFHSILEGVLNLANDLDFVSWSFVMHDINKVVPSLAHF